MANFRHILAASWVVVVTFFLQFLCLGSSSVYAIDWEYCAIPQSFTDPYKAYFGRTTTSYKTGTGNAVHLDTGGAWYVNAVTDDFKWGSITVSPRAVATNTWYTVTMTFDGNTVTGYIFFHAFNAGSFNDGDPYVVSSYLLDAPNFGASQLPHTVVLSTNSRLGVGGSGGDSGVGISFGDPDLDDSDLNSELNWYTENFATAYEYDMDDSSSQANIESGLWFQAKALSGLQSGAGSAVTIPTITGGIDFGLKHIDLDWYYQSGARTILHYLFLGLTAIFCLLLVWKELKKT